MDTTTGQRRSSSTKTLTKTASSKKKSKTVTSRKGDEQTQTQKQTPALNKDGTKKKRQSRRKETYNTYIFKLLKNLPETKEFGLTKRSMSVLNSFTQEIFDKVVSELDHISVKNEYKKKTILDRDIRSSCRFILPGELSKHAIAEGEKAVTKFKNNKKDSTKKTKSSRADLNFPVARVSRYLKNSPWGWTFRFSNASTVYLTAVMEYLIGEVLIAATEQSKEQNRKLINNHHIQLGIQKDEELQKFFTATIAGGGVVPHIHKFLINKKAKTEAEPQNTKKNKRSGSRKQSVSKKAKTS